MAFFQDFPVLENAKIKFQDFPGFPGPVRTLMIGAQNQKPHTYSPTNVGIEQEYWQSLSYLLSTAGQDKGKDIRMARHKQCQSLGEVATQT